MEYIDVAALFGGLALFFCGMQNMTEGIRQMTGERLQHLITSLTTNRVSGAASGAFLTAVLQSSSAVTVMTVGLVDAGMMSLNQAVGVIIGANIGTTVTGQLIALDIGALAPFAALFGIALTMIVKKPLARWAGTVLTGLGLLFLGMEMMSGALMPLHGSQMFLNRMERCADPLTGILTGAIAAALIQSSSAAVGILQALAAAGAVPFEHAVYVLFGQNIGTCITAVLSVIGAGKNAKRTALVHLMFNVTGTVVFTVLCKLTPLTVWVGALAKERPAAQIANMHTLFNLATAAMLLPFADCMVRVAEHIVPDGIGKNRTR